VALLSDIDDSDSAMEGAMGIIVAISALLEIIFGEDKTEPQASTQGDHYNPACWFEIPMITRSKTGELVENAS
jgi:hypothetical protein